MSIRRIGVLTSGGDAPGMNTAIRAVVRGASARDVAVMGIEDGYDGLLEGRCSELRVRDVGDILQKGGTFLQTARCQEMFTEAGQVDAVRAINSQGIDGLVVIGGDGSLRGAHRLHELGVAVVGIPASIDNDINGTSMALGVDTALNTILDATDKLRDTASSHERAFLIETMGRGSGYLATMAGLISGAELVVIPEVPTTVEEVGKAIQEAYSRGKTHAFVVVAEGATPQVSEIAAHLDTSDIGFKSRVTILGHVQRGGRPTAFDRLLATRMGITAVNALIDGASDVMTGLGADSITMIPLEDAVAEQRDLDREYYDMITVLAR
jgi:6-phosphofructokinase 1